MRRSRAAVILADEAEEGQVMLSMVGHAVDVGFHSLRWDAVRNFGREDTILT